MTTLDQQLDRLAGFEPTGFPVISLYINAQADDRGKDRFWPFIRKELHGRLRAFGERSSDRESYAKDVARIEEYLNSQLDPSANGVAIFACGGADLFEAVQMEAPVEQTALYVNSVPNLYPLARLNDQFPRYAALVVDTNSARLFVFNLRKTERQEEVKSDKTKRMQAGGWSQARYQRQVENMHLHHVKEVIDMLDKIVTGEGIQHILIGGDQVVVPILREQMPKHLEEKIVDILPLDIRTPDHEVLAATLDKMRQEDAKTDAEKVSRMYDNYRAGGLGVIGSEDTLTALGVGQVDELLIVSLPDRLETNPNFPTTEELAAALVTGAKQTGAKVTFIEDAALLEEAGGVGAILRYKI